MVLGGRLWEFTSTHHSQFPLLRMRVLSLLTTSLCISSRRLYPQLWKEVILDSYSCEKKGVLPVEKSSYTWSCRRKISWIPAALERKLLCLNQAVLTATREGIKDSYSTEGKGTLAGRSQAVHTAVKGRYPRQLKPWGERKYWQSGSQNIPEVVFRWENVSQQDLAILFLWEPFYLGSTPLC